MKTTAKQLLAVLLALVMTVSFMTVMAVSTSAATTPVPVGTNGDIQGVAFYVRKDTEVTFRYRALTDTLTVERNVDLEMTDSEYTLPYEETPTTMEPTSEPIGETLELYCRLEIHRPDGAVMESGMYQAVMGFSPTFTADISDLPVFDTPYKATLNVYSCIWPDELVFSSDEWFYVRSEGTVSFRAYAPGGSLTISGDGVELTTDPDVTYPTTLPDVTTLPQEWTTSPATTAPAYHGDICFGDVDMNGKLTIADATLIQRAAIDLVKFSQNQLYLADVNGDSRISILDVTCIQKYLAEFRDGTALAGEFAMTLI